MDPKTCPNYITSIFIPNCRLYPPNFAPEGASSRKEFIQEIQLGGRAFLHVDALGSIPFTGKTKQNKQKLLDQLFPLLNLLSQ